MADKTDERVKEEREETRTVEESSAVGGVLGGSFSNADKDEASPVEEEIAREEDAAREED